MYKLNTAKFKPSSGASHAIQLQMDQVYSAAPREHTGQLPRIN